MNPWRQWTIMRVSDDDIGKWKIDNFIPISIVQSVNFRNEKNMSVCMYVYLF